MRVSCPYVLHPGSPSDVTPMMTPALLKEGPPESPLHVGSWPEPGPHVDSGLACAPSSSLCHVSFTLTSWVTSYLTPEIAFIPCAGSVTPYPTNLRLPRSVQAAPRSARLKV